MVPKHRSCRLMALSQADKVLLKKKLQNASTSACSDFLEGHCSARAEHVPRISSKKRLMHQAFLVPREVPEVSAGGLMLPPAAGA